MDGRHWSPADDWRLFWTRSRGRVRRSGQRRFRGWAGRSLKLAVSWLKGTNIGPVGFRVRRGAADWARARMGYSAGIAVALLSATFGMLLGVVLVEIVGWQLALLAVFCLLVVVVLLVRRFVTNGLSRLLKGAAAERNVGGLIEYGITAPGCAIAHSVTEIAEIGDIDHLVATPGCLWVVETKYGKVPKERFGEVLRRLRANQDAVRRWASTGTEVRACLVLATEDGPRRKRLYENGQVELFDPKSLVCELRRKSANPACSADLLTARRVWALAGEFA